MPSAIVLPSFFQQSESNPNWEQEAHDAQEIFLAIVESMKDAFVMANTHDDIVYWNQAAQHMFGYTSEEVLGKNLHSIIPPSLDVEKYHKDMAEFATSGKTWVVGRTFELEAKKKDGSTFFVELSVSSLNIHGQWFAIGTMRDITLRKQITAQLEHSEQRFKRLIEKAPLGIALINKDETYAYVNPQFTELFGYTLEEIPNRETWYRLAYRDPVYIEQLHKDWREIFIEKTAKTNMFHSISPIICKDGTKKITQILGSATDDGEVFVMYQNVTEQKTIEEAFQQKNKILDEKAMDLERMNQLMVGRELKMIELKAEIEQLRTQLQEQLRIQPSGIPQ